MADAFYHRYYRGVLLVKICYSLGVPQGDHKKVCDVLHRSFKEYFCVKSTANFDNHTFLTYLSAILMIMAREKGLLVPIFNEPDHIGEMTMTEWFALCKIIDN